MTLSGHCFNGIKFILEDRIIQLKKSRQDFSFLNKGRNNRIHFFKKIKMAYLSHKIKITVQKSEK